MLFTMWAVIVMWPMPFVSGVWTTNDLTPKNYNPLRLPKVDVDKPVVVKVTVVLISLLAVNEAEQSFTADIIYKLRWSDYRLQLPVLDVDYPLILEPSWKSKIWTPDIYFQNALRTSLLTGFSPITFIEIKKNNDVSLSARLTVKLNCDMQLFSYPHDTQECFFDSISLTHSCKNIELMWDKFNVDKTIYFPKFRIFEYRETNCTHPDSTEQHTAEPSKSCVRGVLKLSRKLSYYITRYYAPSFLIVVTSMVGFWIPPAAWPARVTVVVTPLLSLITIHNTLNSEINVSYVVAIHIWMFVSMTFVFLALIEYALAIVHVNSLEDKKNDPKNVPSITFERAPGSMDKGIKRLLTRVYGSIDWTKAPLNRNMVDYIARLIFPFVYLIFIILFFTIFLVPWLWARA